MAETGLNRALEAGPAAGVGGAPVPANEAPFEAWAARIDALVKDNQALTRTLDSERHEKARLLSAVSRLQGENSALRETLAPAHAMSDEVSALTGAVTAQSARLDALAEHVKRLGQPTAPGAQGADEAAERLHAILTSRSWRMMRPLRGLGRLARRLRG